MSKTIGGRLDYSLLHDHARLVHRPTDPEALRLAALELQRSGLTTHDIAGALQIGERAVQQLLQGGGCA